MKNKVYKNLLGVLLTMTFFSCSDYLDVDPEDKFLENQAFNTEVGINNVLNGIYLDLTGTELYGGNLTMSVIDVLGQRYNVPSDRHTYYTVSRYDYNDKSAMDKFEEIWTKSYVNILGLNKFIENLETYKGVLTQPKENLLKGEAYGLRAMLHFDLLRLFGPIYSEAPSDLSIPYYTEAKAELNSILPAEEVMSLILSDLYTAEQLLKNDPIITNGTRDFGFLPDEAVDEYYTLSRNRRLNYYAIKALQARANLYADNKPEALAAATVVIAGSKFPWTEPTKVISAGANPDRTFSPEIIFALDNRELYLRQRDFFSSDNDDNAILAPHSTRLSQVFENNENDYRYNPSWILPSDGTKTYRTFYKYADIVDKDQFQFLRFLQPLIRVTEMYYIAAEAGNDLSYLNTVRFNRGLVDLPVGTDIDTELRKEYQKEFYGEGQLFFYYKRKNISSIPRGYSSSGNISMGPNTYIVPLPKSETNFQS